jgi:endonuclease YncB( thermonuclease family)
VLPVFAVLAARVTTCRLLLAVLAVALAVPACAESKQAQRYSRARVQESLERLESPGLVIGEFALAPKPVLDGDTIRVEGLDSTMRLIGLDSEETLKSEHSRREAEEDWPTYLKEQRGRSKHPTKAGTPMGEEAKKFALSFFSGVSRVRLERDDAKEIRDRFDRYLAYAFVRKNGRWINYNVEAVRAGMSPYFTKYSFSRRFHDEFAAAEKEARGAQRGIWNPAKRAYRDYDERRAWWDARARFIKAFERDGHKRDDFIVLTHWDSLARLEKKLGQEVTVLGTVSSVKLGDRGPTRVLLGRRRFSDFALIFFDKDVFSSCGIGRYQGEFVRVTGVVAEYRNKYNNRRQLQLIVNLPSQVVVSDVPGLEAPAQAASHP